MCAVGKGNHEMWVAGGRGTLTRMRQWGRSVLSKKAQPETLEMGESGGEVGREARQCSQHSVLWEILNY